MLYLALPVAALGILAFIFRRRLSIPDAELVEDDLGEITHLPSRADVDRAWRELEVYAGQGLFEIPHVEPEHSHRSPLAGRRPPLRLFAAERPFDHPVSSNPES